MNRNWIFISVYIFLIAAITFLVSTFSEAKKIVSFIESNEEVFQEDRLALISSNVLVYNNDGTQAYIIKEPLYSQDFSKGKTSLDIDIYSLVEFNNNRANNSVAILVSNLDVSEFYTTKDDQDYTILNAEIEFNQTISYNNIQTKKFNDTFTTMYDDTSKLILFNFDKLEALNPIEIKSIKISINENFNNVTQPKLLVHLENMDLSTTNPIDHFEDNIDRNIFKLKEANFKSLEKYGTSNLENNSELYFNSGLLNKLNSFNYYRILYIVIEFLVLIPITYLIFFHAYVLSVLRDKKRIKIQKHNDLVNEIKKEKGE